MKTAISIVVLAFLLIPTIYSFPDIAPVIVHAQEIAAPIAVTMSTTSVSDLINADVKKYAAKWGVNAAHLGGTVWCELNGTASTTLQSYDYQNGQREQSFGPAQWNLPAGNLKQDGTPITYSDAINPDTAIDTMAWYFATGRADKWTCYRNMYE